jgi:sarcinarray family protein
MNAGARAFIFLMVFALFISMAADASAKNIIKAYYNGEEATVTGITLKVGEPFTVDFNVTPDRYTTVAALLREPGGGDAYELISGDAKDVVVRKKGGPDDPVHFQWVLAPGEEWTDGTAPLNIQYDVWGETMDTDTQGYFTVVEAYISPERYQQPKQAGDDPLIIIITLAASFFIASRHMVRKR